MAIKNLYTRCLATAGRTSIPRLKDKDGDLLDQLDFYLKVVQDRVMDLNEIVREFDNNTLRAEKTASTTALLISNASLVPAPSRKE